MRHTIFETERLRCRRWMATDFEALLAVYSDAEAMRWVGDGQPITQDQCAAWFRVTEANYLQRGYGMFTVEERAANAVVGHRQAAPSIRRRHAFAHSVFQM